VPELAAYLSIAQATGTAAAPDRRPRLTLPRADRREIAAIFAGGALAAGYAVIHLGTAMARRVRVRR